MPGTTPSGWSYVLPTDHPLEYPAQSQAEANLLESNKLMPGATTWAPTAPYADIGGVNAGLYVSRVGNLVVVEGTVKPTSDQSVTATVYTVGTLPAGYRPVHDLSASCPISMSGGPAVFGRLLIRASDGVLRVSYPSSGTITAAGGFIPISASFRAA